MSGRRIITSLVATAGLLATGLVAPAAAQAVPGDVTVTIVKSGSATPVVAGSLWLYGANNAPTWCNVVANAGVCTFTSTQLSDFGLTAPYHAEFVGDSDATGTLWASASLTGIAASSSVDLPVKPYPMSLALTYGASNDTDKSVGQIGSPLTVVDTDTGKAFGPSDLGDDSLPLSSSASSTGLVGLNLAPGSYALILRGVTFDAYPGPVHVVLPMARVLVDVVLVDGKRTLVLPGTSTKVTGVRRVAGPSDPVTVTTGAVVAGGEALALSADGQTSLWWTANDLYVHRQGDDSLDLGYVARSALSRNGDFAATIGFDRVVTLTNTTSGVSRIAKVSDFHPNTASLAVSNDGHSIVALGTNGGAPVLRHWDTTGSCFSDDTQSSAPNLAPSCDDTIIDLVDEFDLFSPNAGALALAASGDVNTLAVQFDDPPSPLLYMLVVTGATGATPAVSNQKVLSLPPNAVQTAPAMASNGSVAAFPLNPNTDQGRMYLWRSDDTAFTAFMPGGEEWAASIPAAALLSQDGTRMAVAALGTPGFGQGTWQVLTMDTAGTEPVRATLIDDTTGNLTGDVFPTLLGLSGNDATFWTTPSNWNFESPPRTDDRGGDEYNPLYGTGRSIVTIAAIRPGLPDSRVGVITEAGSGGGGGGGGDGGGGGGGGGDVPLARPLVSLQFERLTPGRELTMGGHLGITVNADPQAQSAVASIDCADCPLTPLSIDLVPSGSGRFSGRWALPSGASLIRSVTVTTSAAGFVASTGEAADLPAGIASRFRITLQGSGANSSVGANASEQLRTSRLVATRQGTVLPYASEEIGTATSVAFNVPTTADGVRLVTRAGELLGTTAVAARAGQEVAGTVLVRERVRMVVEVPQMKAPAGAPPPFEPGDIDLSVVASDGSVVAQQVMPSSGTLDLGPLPAPETYTLTASIRKSATGQAIASYASSKPTDFLLQPGAENQTRTATVNLEPVDTGPADFAVLTRRVTKDSEGIPVALVGAQVTLLGITRSDGIRLSQTWKGQTDDSGLVTLDGVPAGTYRVQINGGRSFGEDNVTIPAPASRERLTVKASSYDPITIPFLIETGVRPGESNALRAEWRNLVHYHVNLWGTNSVNQTIPADVGDTSKSGDYVLAGPGIYTLCGTGAEANLPGMICTKLEVDADGKTFTLGDDGSRKEGLATLRLVPAAAIEIPRIDGLDEERLDAARVSVNGEPPVSLLPWLVSPTKADPASGASGRSGLVSLAKAGTAVLTLQSSGGRVSTTTITVSEGETVAVTPRFGSDDDLLGPGSAIITATDPVTPELPALLRVNVEVGTEDLAQALLDLDLPAGVSVVPESVTIDGVPQLAATTAIDLGDVRAKALIGVSMQVQVDEGVSGPQVIAAAVTSDGRSDSIPGTYLPVGGVTLQGPSTAQGRKVIVSGRTAPSVQVEVINEESGESLGMGTSATTGFYQFAVELPQVSTLTDFRLVARIVGSDPVVRSRPLAVRYDPSSVVITSVTITQVNPDDPKDARTLTGDPRNGVIRGPLVWVPGHIPSVSFTVDDPARVRRALVTLGTATQYAVRKGSVFVATFPRETDAGNVDIRIDVTKPVVSETPTTTTNDVVSQLPPLVKNPVIESTLTPSGARTVIAWDKPTGGVTALDLNFDLKPAPQGAKPGVVQFPFSPYADGRMESKTWPPALIVNIPVSDDPFATRSKGDVASKLWQGTVNLVKGTPKDPSKQGLLKPDGIAPDNGIEGGFAIGLSADGIDGARKAGEFPTKINDFVDQVMNECGNASRQQHLLAEAEKLLNLSYRGQMWYGVIYSLITLPIKNPLLGIPAGLIGSYYGKQYDAALDERLDLLRSKLDECRVETKWLDKIADNVRKALDPESEPAGGTVAAPTVIYDPSGYVFEAVRSNRVPGATATLYEHPAQDDTGSGTKWDAVPYLQQNDLTTNGVGYYSWNVPPGFWKVRIAKDGYAPAASPIVEVLPPQLDVNIPLVSTQDPKLASVRLARNGSVIVTFSQYMTVESITRAVRAAARVPSGKGSITFTSSAEGADGKGLPADPSAPVAADGSTVMLSRTLILRPVLRGIKAMPKGTRITVTVGAGATSYTGRVLPAQPARPLVR